MKEKKYISDIPELMKEWDWDANVGLDPFKITYGSHKKAWWKCLKCNYRWYQAIMERTRKIKPAHCPCCTSRVVVKGINDFATFNPEDAKEWHPTKNGDLKPDMVTSQSDKLIWWKCLKCESEWQVKVRNKRRCPYCLHKPQKGIDDLETLRPDLAEQWHPIKNGGLKPQDVKLQSNKKVWWVCPNNHEYQAKIGERTRVLKGTNCPVCFKQNRTSFPEQAIFYYVKKLYPDAINSYRASFLGNMELDIYIPSLNLAIEYDGKYWHKKEKIKREQVKYQKCFENGIKLLRIREKMADLASDISDNQIGIVKFNGKESLEETIKYLMKYLNFSKRRCIYINLKRDEIKIRENYQRKVKDSIAELCPELIKEWHPTKNGLLTPNDCKIGSTYKVWWLCQKCGYEWEATPSARSVKGHGCLNCSKQKPFAGVNDLETLYPEIAKEWHPTKNGIMLPCDVRPNTNKKIWWSCSKCQHEWLATGNSRVHLRTGCPACAGRVPRKGENDLFTVCPHLEEEWDFELNKEFDSSILPIGSHTKVWWICSKCDYKWQAEIRRRVKGLSKCPNCSKKQKST